ncbi:hypothetical protein B0919_02855 [Hymenobacter sp. CRA2]|nr:hypothetical protein B0919_02855 [Hymenobacter sp. CRA2]
MRWLPVALLLTLPLSATAQRAYNNWVNPNSGRPAPEARKPKPAAKPQPAPAPAYRQPDSVGGKAVFLRVEQMPVYPGGHEAMQQYIRKHLQRPKGSPRLSGPVQVTFTVLQNGTVANAHVRPGTGLDARYDAAAVQVISELKGFSGGRRNGEPADLEVTLPVEFR